MTATAAFPQPNSLIVVAFNPSPRDYVAIYQLASFGENQKWCLERYTPVRGPELMTRAELMRTEPDHPKAGKEYFKIQLGPLQKLANPIRAEKWKRIPFFCTTGEYFLEAETISDLVVHSDERKLLWQSLCERTGQEQIYNAPEADMPPEVLAALLGIKGLEEESE